MVAVSNDAVWDTQSHSPADATVTPSVLASLKSRVIEAFWCRLTQLSWKRGR